MKKTKLLSVIIAFVLLCACVAATLMFTASAESAVLYAVGCEVAGADASFDTLAEAMAAAEKRTWTSGETLEIRFSGTQPGNAAGSNLLFGAKTIWRGAGDKLPITILGVDADKAAKISLAAGRVACANDYTFRDLLLDTKTNNAQFFAGSGNIVLKDLQTLSNSSGVGYLFADSFTADVYQGWKKADVEAVKAKSDKGLIETSITLDGTSFRGTNSIALYPSIACVGAKIGDEYTATASDDESVVISPATCRATVYLLKGRVNRICGYWAQQPAKVHTARLIAEGDPKNMTAVQTGYFNGSNDVGSSKTDTAGDVENTYKQVVRDGNVELYAKDCTITSLRVLYYCGIETDDADTFGNSTVKLENVHLESVTAAGNDDLLVPGKSYLSLINITDSNSGTDAITDVYAIGGKLGTEIYIDNYVGMKRFCGIRGKAYENNAKIKITMKNTTVNNYYNAFNVTTGTLQAGELEQYFENCTFTKNHYVNSYQIKSCGDITSEFKNCTFTGNFYGGVWKGNCGNVSSTLSGCTVTGNYVGGSGNESGNVNGTVTNIIKDGTTISGYFQGAGSTAQTQKVTNIISGGTFTGDFYGGSSTATVAEVENRISGGTFKSFYMGAGATSVTGTVTNTISGGDFKHFVMGGGIVTAVEGDINNTITGGTFAQPVYGGSCGSSVGDIKNELSGPAKFNAGFCGVQGAYTSAPSCDSVTNHVFADADGKAPTFISPKAPEFTYNDVTYDNSYIEGFAFLGGACSGTVRGVIKNTVEAGDFGTTSLGMYKGGNRIGNVGRDADGVSVYNTIKGGNFHYRWYGGNFGIQTGEIRSVIEGGVFENEFTGGARSLADIKYPISVTIKGGEFFNDIFATYFGYTADQCSKVSVQSAVTLNIEDGVFRGNIFGLGNGGGATSNRSGTGITSEGSVNVNLYGGEFYGDIYPTCESPVETRMLGVASVNVQPKCGDIILGGKSAPRFAAEKYALKGASYDIYVNGEGALTATSAEGVIDFQQIDKWKSATYLTLPAGHNATVNVTTAPDAYGYFETKLGENEEILEVYGTDLKVGASMILTERIALKFQLSKTAVDAVENFTYSFTLPDGTVLAEGTKADLSEMIELTEFEYYTLTLKALGISQFDTPITVNVKGLWENDTFSIFSLATSAVSAWEGNDDFVLMAKAIVNMAKAAKGEALPYTLTPDAVSYERKAPSRDEDALFKASQKSLLMSSAVGLRISGTVASAADAEGLAVKVNGNDVTDLSVIKVEGTDVTVDLYFSAYGMGEEFELQILDKNGKNCLTMLERLDAFANEYGAEHTLAYSLLSYIQATSDMAKASFNMAASEEEIAYLNSLYAGETAYYGDLHGHPGGGIIEDGKVDMSDWVKDRTTIGVDFYTAMNHKQVAHMYDDGWDDTVLIGGSEPAASITKDGKRISLHYNMIVPNPEALIEVLQLFPEFNYTGGTGDIAINMGTFGYPGFTYDRFNELVSAIKERGGTVVNVHPKQQHTSDEPLDYYYQDYMGLEVFYSYTDKNIHGKDSQDNYKLWTDLLAMGKRVWATAGSDSHGSPVNTGLTTLYSSEALNTKYVEKIATGNMAPGYAGIRMAIGDVEMGGHTDFEGKKLIFSVGDIHEKYLSETRAYKVNVITDQGVVYSAVIDGTKTTYFSLNADEDAKFYRIEVVDEELQGLPIVGLGNPIWND